jgi:hypothetical protein
MAHAARAPESRVWVFTYWDTCQRFKEFLSNNSHKIRRLRAQLEIGEENGTRHIQGVLETRSPTSHERMRKLFAPWANKSTYIARCRNIRASAFYVWKKHTHPLNSERFQIGDWPNWIPLKKKSRQSRSSSAANSVPTLPALAHPEEQADDPLEGLTPFPFQQFIIDEVNKTPDKRTIVWIYDPHGNSGKTQLAKHLLIKYPRKILFLSGGRYNDAVFHVAKFVSIVGPRKLRAVIMNLGRTKIVDDKAACSYQAIEAIKDGLVFSPKYESCQAVFNCPHVIVLANALPDRSQLTQDRWRIFQLDHDTKSVQRVLPAKPTIECSNGHLRVIFK